MPFLFVEFQSVPLQITVDLLIAKISDQISGTKVTTEDWYADRRVMEEGVIENLRAKGRPMIHGNHILESIDRAAASYGPTKGVAVPMGEQASLEGRISRHHMLVHSDALIDQNTVDQLLAVFRSLNILKDFRVSQVPTRRKMR